MVNTGHKEAQEEFRGRYFILVTLFFTGAAVMVLELLGSRIIGPYYGVSLYVWSSLITVTLISLSIGYWLGGRIADSKVTEAEAGDEEKIASRHHTSAQKAAGRLYLFILLAGIYIMFMPMISEPVLKATSPMGIRVGALLSTLILFTVPLVLLGMASPYAIKLLTDRLKVVGTTAGNLFAVSTIGSFIGTILTGFVLIPNMGTRKILYAQAVVLIGLWAVWAIINRKFAASALALPFIAICVSNAMASAELPEVDGFKVVHKEESPYGQLKVVDRENKRWLSIDGAGHTGINKNTGLSLFPYSYYLEIMDFMRPEAKDALVIGLGGGSVTSRFESHGILVDSVEIDRKVVDIARNYFGFKGPEANVFIQDGRTYVTSTSKKYDYVIMDAFVGSDTPPSHMLTTEMFGEMKGILKKDGIVAVNTFGFHSGQGVIIPESIYATLKEVFPNVRAFSTTRTENLSNIIFLASEGEIALTRELEGCDIEGVCQLLKEMLDKEVTYADGRGVVLTDDYNPVEAWGIWTSEAVRKNIMAFYPAGILAQ